MSHHAGLQIPEPAGLTSPLLAPTGGLWAGGPRKTCREIQAYWGEGRIDRPVDRQRALEILEAGLAVLIPLALASR